MCLVGIILSRSLQAFTEDKHRDAFMIAEVQRSDQGVTEAKRLFFSLLKSRQQVPARVHTYELENVFTCFGLDHFNRSTFNNMKWH